MYGDDIALVGWLYMVGVFFVFCVETVVATRNANTAGWGTKKSLENSVACL
jgi:hypothetical protein